MMTNHFKFVRNININYIIIAIFSFFFTTLVYADEIAITFDDLPGQKSESAENQRIINAHILNTLKKYNASAIGFVNEGKLYDQGETQEKIAILKSWIDAGHPLGNHTYSHPSLNNSKLDSFKKDVIKGADVSKKLMHNAGLTYCYFRHPYLHTGSNPKIRSDFERFLKKENYIIAPVTIDTDDWKFNQQLIDNPKDKEKIIQKYLQHTNAKFAFYKHASQKIFNRNIKHIWLLHVNLINAYAMNELLDIVHNLKYDIIPLNQALKDPVYSQTDNYYAAFGVSWLYRWDFTRGKVVDWSQDPEPDNNPFIKATELKLFDKQRNRSVPIELYVSGESEGKAKAGISKLPVAVINHGYGAKNTEYTFLANDLAAKGYFVVSIQQDLTSDLPLPRTGNLFEKRKPYWECGVQNLLFTISELKKIKPYINLDKVLLIGHSNGGDISMLFATNHPKQVSKLISLDSLRYPFPTKDNIPILSLRANDTTADEGVLPQSNKYIHIVPIEAKHIDMYDAAPIEIKQKIIDQISKFLIK